MFCYNCGKEVDDKAVVCPGCGAVLNEEALSAAKAAQARQQAENKAADKDEFFDAPPQQTPPPRVFAACTPACTATGSAGQ